MPFVAQVAVGLSADRRVAILLPNREREASLLSLLARSGRPVSRLHRDLRTWPERPRIFYGTYSAAKGMEFDSVILPFCDVDELPRPAEVDAHGLDEAKARDARQLYVAVTRARSDLVFVCSGALTDLLPDEGSSLFTVLPA